MKDRAHVVIIGGGVSGCALAYYLAKKGQKKIIILEKDFLGAGSTGRCGGGVRQQFGTEIGVKLAMESAEIFESLGDELGIDLEYRRDGYLLLAETKEQEIQLKKNQVSQRKMGLDVQYLSPDEVKKIAPMLNVESVLGGTYCPTDGCINPFKVLYGYAKKATELGVEIRKSTEFTGIIVKNGHISGVRTNKGEIETSLVVNAAGACAKKIAAMTGVELPILCYKREMSVTEPIEHIVDPYIIGQSGAVRQAKGGELLVNTFKLRVFPDPGLTSSVDFLKRTASSMTRLFPQLSVLNIVRQWVGHYMMTPDENPILGETQEVSGFIQSNGYSGHGLMIAPRIGQLLAEWIVDGISSEVIETYNLRRFEKAGGGTGETGTFVGPDMFGLEYMRP